MCYPKDNQIAKKNSPVINAVLSSRGRLHFGEAETVSRVDNGTARPSTVVPGKPSIGP